MFCVQFAAILVLMMVITDVKSDGSSSNSGSKDSCDHLSKQGSKDSSWITDADKRIIYKSKSLQLPVCQCPINGGLNDITRIQTPTTSYTICTGCPGNEKEASDVKFCTNSYGSSSSHKCNKTFGPCSGVTVYRCECLLPSTEGPIVGGPAPGTPTVGVPATEAPVPTTAYVITIFDG